LVLRNMLAELAERVEVRVLAWAGAPLPMFRPSRRGVKAIRDAFCEGTKIRFALDARERPLHCHHEKIVVVDDRVAFVGGIDLSDLVADRFDDPDHQPRKGSQNWHDATSMLQGPVVADVAAGVAARWSEVAGEALASPVAPP